jgi:hypothetical protein
VDLEEVIKKEWEDGRWVSHLYGVTGPKRPHK